MSRLTLTLGDLYGKRVWVYRNLRAGKHEGRFRLKTYSVMYRNRVVAHVNEIMLSDVEFVVRPGGQKRVREQKRKNVHAFVVGTVVRDAMGIDATGTLPCRVTYNPYQDDKFVSELTPRGYIAGAMACVINQEGVSAAYTVSQ